MSDSQERIVAAAIKVTPTVIAFAFAPARHAELIRELGQERFSCEQGFLTSENRFVSREEAADIAVEAGQVPKGSLFISGRLYTENLW